VAGARGYAGLELVRMLMRHPAAELAACFAGESTFKPADYLPEAAAAALPVLAMDKFEETAARVRVIFLATPAEVSAELAPKALARGTDVIDLSGAFRLDRDGARAWYGLEAVPPAQATYGLVPWAGPQSGAAPRLVANPGCYATAVLMALLPLLREGLIEPGTLVIDAKSGATGAGRKAAENLLFCEVEGGCLPYKVGRHQHLPEIRKVARELGGAEIDPLFTTHLLPVRRGIIAGLYARASTGVTHESIQSAYAKAYDHYPLLRFGRAEGAARQLLGLQRIAGSARTEIRYELVDGKLYVFSLIDNLLKGAASQAVENFNRLYDLPLTTALTEMEGVL
jgi:N-acetyl-gamma-glutamyl-phosphate reductase